MADFVRVNASASLKEVLRAVLSAKGRVVYIDIADGSTLWELKSLRLLRRAGLETEKKLVVVSGTRINRIKATQAGLAAASPDELPGKPNAMKSTSSKTTTFVKSGISKKPAPVKATESIASSPAQWISSRTGDLAEPGKKRKLLFAASAIMALLTGFVVSTVVLQKAEIIVYAHTDTVGSDFDVVFDKNITNDTPGDRAILAYPVREIKKYSQKFDSTGSSAGLEASGEAVIYSSFPNTLTLRAETTYLEAASGVRYRLQSNITGLRPNVPYSVQVAAERGGSQGNIAAEERLERHNSAFGSRPQVLYARVGAAGMTGGSDSDVLTVSDQDFQKARELIGQKAIEEIKSNLSKTISDNVILIPELTNVRVVSESYEAKIDDVRPDFTGELEVEVTGLAFNDNSVLELAVVESSRSLLTGQKFLEVEQGSVRYTTRSSELERGLAVVNVNLASRFTYDLDPDDLKSLLAGRSTREIKDILLNKGEIAGIKISLSPFWLTKTPKSSKKIHIKVEVQQ